MFDNYRNIHSIFDYVNIINFAIHDLLDSSVMICFVCCSRALVFVFCFVFHYCRYFSCVLWDSIALCRRHWPVLIADLFCGSISTSIQCFGLA